MCSFYLHTVWDSHVQITDAVPIFTAGMHICIPKSPALVLTANKSISPGHAHARAPLPGPIRAERNLRHQFVNCRQKKRSLQSSIESSRPKPLTVPSPDLEEQEVGVSEFSKDDRVLHLAHEEGAELNPPHRIGSGAQYSAGPDPSLFSSGGEYEQGLTGSMATPYKRQSSAEQRDSLEPGNDYEALQISGGAVVEPWRSAMRHVLVACLAAGLFGYHMGVVNGPLGYLARDLGFAGNTLIQGMVVSIFLIGAFVGCAASSVVADGLGRRRSFQLAGAPILIGTILSASAPGMYSMLVGRCLCGLGLGLCIPVMALYISEISPTAQRGTFGGLAQVSTCLGILGALVASLPLPYTPGWWRACFWFATVPAALLILLMEISAESPRWLAKSGRWAEAERAAETLWGAHSLKTAMADLKAGGMQEGEREVGWGDLVSRRYIKVVTIGAAVFALQQMAGINAIFYFSSTIFRQAGIESDMAASTLMGVVNLLAAFGSMALMDRLGRKKLMMLSFGGMGVAMSVQALCQALPAFASSASSVSVFGTLAYVVAFAMGAGPVPALLLPEIFPGRIRAKAMAVAMCVHWVCNFVIGFSFLPLLKAWGAPLLYSCFASVCFLAVYFTKHQIIETKGKSLEEIERLLTPEL